MVWATHEPCTIHPKRTRLVTEGLHPELVGHSGYTHAVSDWWGLYPVSPVNGFRQGAPPPFFFLSGPAPPRSILVEQRGLVRFPFTSLNFRFRHNCHHHRRQSCVAFLGFWGGHVSTQTPPSGFKGQASQAMGSWPGGRRMRLGVLTNHLGSSNHFVFSSRIKSRTTKCLLNIRSRWASW
jgi:hypothetical protein